MGKAVAALSVSRHRRMDTWRCQEFDFDMAWVWRVVFHQAAVLVATVVAHLFSQ